ncbi:MAG: ChbG/HpnK family deacetylase [Firmicutes bacterium]|nr:ChbG/HpnK family deacetylase [Bacillota bacterium]
MLLPGILWEHAAELRYFPVERGHVVFPGQEDARAELEAQIAAAKQMGLDVTHLDTHMGAVLRPDLAQIYVDLALKERVPAFVPENLEDLHMPEPVRTALRDLLERTPLPRVRAVDSYPAPPDQRRRWYVQTLSSLGPGVYHLIHHAAMATPEAQNLPDWKKRLADFEALQDPEVRRVVDRFTLLTYRQVRDAMRRL